MLTDLLWLCDVHDDLNQRAGRGGREGLWLWDHDGAWHYHYGDLGTDGRDAGGHHNSDGFLQFKGSSHNFQEFGAECGN